MAKKSGVTTEVVKVEEHRETLVLDPKDLKTGKVTRVEVPKVGPWN